MTKTATAAAARRSTIGPTALKASIRASAVVVALAAGASLFAAPPADARPPRELEDRINELKAGCLSKRRGTWLVNGVFGYICQYNVPGSEVLKQIDNQGEVFLICYRFDPMGPWYCN